MKIHWRTEDRWLREFKAGDSFLEIAVNHQVVVNKVEDAIRRAIRRRERKGKKSNGIPA